MLGLLIGSHLLFMVAVQTGVCFYFFTDEKTEVLRS
jgi:hypothetical protein